MQRAFCTNNSQKWLLDLIRPQGQGMGFHIVGLMQERRNSIPNALELRLFCTNPAIWEYNVWAAVCSFITMLGSKPCCIGPQFINILLHLGSITTVGGMCYLIPTSAMNKRSAKYTSLYCDIIAKCWFLAQASVYWQWTDIRVFGLFAL